MTTHDAQTRRLAQTVLVTVGAFLVVVLALNIAQRPAGYRATRDAVSDLALGRGGAWMAVAFCSLGLGTLAFAALLHRTCGHAAVRTALLSLAGALSFVSAAFHTDPTGAPATTHGTIHDAAGIVTFVAMLAAMATSASRFRRDSAWRDLTWPTAALTLLGGIAFFLVPTLGQARFGISQRLLIGSFLAWLLLAARHQVRTRPTRVTSPVDAYGSVA